MDPYSGSYGAYDHGYQGHRTTSNDDSGHCMNSEAAPFTPSSHGQAHGNAYDADYLQYYAQQQRQPPEYGDVYPDQQQEQAAQQQQQYHVGTDQRQSPYADLNGEAAFTPPAGSNGRKGHHASVTSSPSSGIVGTMTLPELEEAIRRVVEGCVRGMDKRLGEVDRKVDQLMQIVFRKEGASINPVAKAGASHPVLPKVPAPTPRQPPQQQQQQQQLQPPQQQAPSVPNIQPPPSHPPPQPPTGVKRGVDEVATPTSIVPNNRPAHPPPAPAKQQQQQQQQQQQGAFLPPPKPAHPPPPTPSTHASSAVAGDRATYLKALDDPTMDPESRATIEALIVGGDVPDAIALQNSAAGREASGAKSLSIEEMLRQPLYAIFLMVDVMTAKAVEFYTKDTVSSMHRSGCLRYCLVKNPAALFGVEEKQDSGNSAIVVFGATNKDNDVKDTLMGSIVLMLEYCREQGYHEQWSSMLVPSHTLTKLTVMKQQLARKGKMSVHGNDYRGKTGHWGSVQLEDYDDFQKRTDVLREIIELVSERTAPAPHKPNEEEIAARKKNPTEEDRTVWCSFVPEEDREHLEMRNAFANEIQKWADDFGHVKRMQTNPNGHSGWNQPCHTGYVTMSTYDAAIYLLHRSRSGHRFNFWEQQVEFKPNRKSIIQESSLQEWGSKHNGSSPGSNGGGSPTGHPHEFRMGRGGGGPHRPGRGGGGGRGGFPHAHGHGPTAPHPHGHGHGRGAHAHGGHAHGHGRDHHPPHAHHPQHHPAHQAHGKHHAQQQQQAQQERDGGLAAPGSTPPDTGADQAPRPQPQKVYVPVQHGSGQDHQRGKGDVSGTPMTAYLLYEAQQKHLLPPAFIKPDCDDIEIAKAAAASDKPEYAQVVKKAELRLNTAMRPLATAGPTDQTPEAFNALLPLFLRCNALMQYISNCHADPLNRPFTSTMARVAKQFLVNSKKTDQGYNLSQEFRSLDGILGGDQLGVRTQLRQMCDFLLRGLHEEMRWVKHRSVLEKQAADFKGGQLHNEDSALRRMFSVTLVEPGTFNEAINKPERLMHLNFYTEIIITDDDIKSLGGAEDIKLLDILKKAFAGELKVYGVQPPKHKKGVPAELGNLPPWWFVFLSWPESGVRRVIMDEVITVPPEWMSTKCARMHLDHDPQYVLMGLVAKSHADAPDGSLPSGDVVIQATGESHQKYDLITYTRAVDEPETNAINQTHKPQQWRACRGDIVEPWAKTELLNNAEQLPQVLLFSLHEKHLVRMLVAPSEDKADDFLIYEQPQPLASGNLPAAGGAEAGGAEEDA